MDQSNYFDPSQNIKTSPYRRKWELMDSSLKWNFFISDLKLSLAPRNFWFSSRILMLKVWSSKYFLNIFVKFCSVRSESFFIGSIFPFEFIFFSALETSCKSDTSEWMDDTAQTAQSNLSSHCKASWESITYWVLSFISPVVSIYFVYDISYLCSYILHIELQ